MNTSQFKQLIKTRLRINDDELTKQFKTTLYSFKRELELIGEKSFIDSLMDLSYDKMIQYDGNKDCFHKIKKLKNSL